MHYKNIGNIVTTLSLIASAIISIPAMAVDAGDYDLAQSISNTFSPPKADNPISVDDYSKVPIAIDLPDPDFKDGFNPGAYGIWQEVTLDPKTGASCGDGSPYKFWVKRTPSSSNIQAILEGGGACWDYKGCSSDLIQGATGNLFKKDADKDRLGFFAASTLKQNSALSFLLLQVGSAFTSDFHPYYKNKSQKWTKVYLPYCTGDVHMGFGTTVYTDPEDPQKHITVQHKGALNVLQVVAWLRNHLQAPKQFMLSGFSAGGVGANSIYFAARRLMAAERGFLLNDGGPIWFTDMQGSKQDNPSKPLFQTALKNWGVSRPIKMRDGSKQSVLDWYETQIPGFDKNEIGSLNNATAMAFPQDRLALLTFQEDYIFSSYIYRRFFPETNVADKNMRRENTLKLWQKDLKTFTEKLSAANFGYYFPATRTFLYAHTLSGKPDATANIQELNLTMSDYAHNVTDGEGAVWRAQEQDFEADRKQKDLIGSIFAKLLEAMGI